MSNLSRPPEREKYPVTKDQSGKYWAELPLPWLRWFTTIQQLLAPVASGGLILWASVSKVGSNLTDLVTRNHNDLQNIQGGAAADNYHFTAVQHTDLTDGGDSNLHYHNSDRVLTWLGM